MLDATMLESMNSPNTVEEAILLGDEAEPRRNGQPPHIPPTDLKRLLSLREPSVWG